MKIDWLSGQHHSGHVDLMTDLLTCLAVDCISKGLQRSWKVHHFLCHDFCLTIDLFETKPEVSLIGLSGPGTLASVR